jgi:hypothetical protein
MARTPSEQGPRTFDPVVLAHHECDAWVAYYRHEWAAFLRAAVGMVQAGFGMSPRRTLTGANLVGAGVPENDPEQAQRLMTRFYALVSDAHGLELDPEEAARREVQWWRVHRELQRERRGADDAPLVAALADLYGYVYGSDPTQARVQEAARQRAAAMHLSDRWVDQGCDRGSPLLDQERRALVASYAALLDAVTTRGA